MAKFHYHSICSLKVARLAILNKIFGEFFTFCILSLHGKWNRTRLLIGETEYANFFTSCQISQDLRSSEIRKFQENLWNALEPKASDQLDMHNKNFDSHARKCKKSTLKPFTAKSFSCNFINSSRIFCQELSEETLNYF